MLMLVAGAYAIWYGRWELAVYRGDLETDPIVEGGEELRIWLISRIDQVGASRLALAIALSVIGLIWLGWTAGRKPVPHTSEDRSSPREAAVEPGRK